MEVTYKDNAKHIGDNIEGIKNVTYGMSQEDRDTLMACVKESGISKDDIDRLIGVLKDINLSQNDLTTEFVSMVEDQKTSQKKGTMKKLQDGVSLTNGMVTLGKTAIGIATSNPGLAVTGVLETAKEMVK